MSQTDSDDSVAPVVLTAPTDAEVIAAGFELVPKDKEYFGEDIKACVPFIASLAKERIEVDAMQEAVPPYPQRLSFSPSEEQNATYTKGEREYSEARERASAAAAALDTKVDAAWLTLSPHAQMTLKARAFDLLWPEVSGVDTSVSSETQWIVQLLCGHVRHSDAIVKTNKRARTEPESE